MKQIKIFRDRIFKELGILHGIFFEDLNHAADGGPDHIVSMEEWRPVVDNALVYTFAPHSVTILSFER